MYIEPGPGTTFPFLNKLSNQLHRTNKQSKNQPKLVHEDSISQVKAKATILNPFAIPIRIPISNLAIRIWIRIQTSSFPRISLSHCQILSPSPSPPSIFTNQNQRFINIMEIPFIKCDHHRYSHSCTSPRLLIRIRLRVRVLIRVLVLDC